MEKLALKSETTTPAAGLLRNLTRDFASNADLFSLLTDQFKSALGGHLGGTLPSLKATARADKPSAEKPDPQSNNFFEQWAEEMAAQRSAAPQTKTAKTPAPITEKSSPDTLSAEPVAAVDTTPSQPDSLIAAPQTPAPTPVAAPDAAQKIVAFMAPPAELMAKIAAAAGEPAAVQPATAPVATDLAIAPAMPAPAAQDLASAETTPAAAAQLAVPASAPADLPVLNLDAASQALSPEAQDLLAAIIAGTNNNVAVIIPQAKTEEPVAQQLAAMPAPPPSLMAELAPKELAPAPKPNTEALMQLDVLNVDDTIITTDVAKFATTALEKLTAALHQLPATPEAKAPEGKAAAPVPVTPPNVAPIAMLAAGLPAQTNQPVSANSTHPTLDLGTAKPLFHYEQNGLMTLKSPSNSRSMPAAQIIEQVTVKLNKAVKSGEKNLTITLNPAELGRVEVKLETAKESGLMRAVVSADNAQTLELLVKDARSLERALADAGVRLEQNALSFNLKQQGDQSFAGAFANQHTNAADTAEKLAAEVAALEAEINHQTYILAPGRVDIRA